MVLSCLHPGILNELPYAFDADNNIQWVLHDEMVPLFQMSEGSE